jgi:hypothetical protein
MVWLILGGFVVVLVLLFALDRMFARGWFDRRPARPRPPAFVGTTPSGLLAELIDVFQPNHVNVTAEQERQQADIQHAEDAAPPIDLDSGHVRIDPQ